MVTDDNVKYGVMTDDTATNWYVTLEEAEEFAKRLDAKYIPYRIVTRDPDNPLKINVFREA